MDSTRYIVVFILILTSLVAVLLTGIREVTKEQAAINEEIFNKRAILAAVENNLPDGKTVKDLDDQEVLDIFNEKVDQKVVDMEGNELDGVMAEDVDMAKERKKPEAERRLPLFIYSNDGQTDYIVSVRGNGLWDEIWGNIALESDLNTITGASFDHKGETPGLGAEIKDNPSFSRQFVGKTIFDDQGDYVSVKVQKGGAPDTAPHKVDAISGATITSDGVTEMLYRGIHYYLPYFKKIEAGEGIPSSQQGMLIQH
ncbi:MAG: NADH:ubiquinone reductase (Na(+)-transporting) subunit C [Phaeodactylibacter sp.]|nr:NADH:ubiquinone reductase (Na(+)-transporting) subunit C [Phaeodactylibacter sp.]